LDAASDFHQGWRAGSGFALIPIDKRFNKPSQRNAKYSIIQTKQFP